MTERDILDELRWPSKISDAESTPAITELRQRAIAEITALREEVDRLRVGANTLINCQSPLSRAVMREALAELLNGKSWPTDDQSPAVGSMVAWKMHAEAANRRADAMKERCAALADWSAANECDEDTPGGFCAANQARHIATAIRAIDDSGKGNS